ncbi:MAG: response regulator [Desulfobacter sp.]|nr:response regulator [Desulfobacter sp.]WDP87112.1 MAG: response regulator [Desulfobacter sp.]
MGQETILFVDDEKYLAEVGKEMLEDYGYEVDTLTDPLAALALFEKDPNRYDLLISDYTMPGMTGDQLVAKIHDLRKDLPAILCTGVRLAPEIEKIKGVSKILLKPFNMDMLIQIVKDVLNEPGT